MKKQIFSVQEALINISSTSELMRSSAVFELVGLRITDLLSNCNLSKGFELEYRFKNLFTFLETEYQNISFLVDEITLEKDELAITDINDYLMLIQETQHLIIEYNAALTQYILLVDDKLAYLHEDVITKSLKNAELEIEIKTKITENNNLILKMKRKEI